MKKVSKCMNFFFDEKRKPLFFGLAITAIVSYFLHVWIGSLLYEGYNPMAQAISDLTADDSPVKHITRIFSNLYGVLSTCVVLGFIAYKNTFRGKMVQLGIVLFSLMMMISAIGYALFPLSKAGLANSFQDVMHIVVTIAVVSLTIIALIVFIIGFQKPFYRVITIIAFLLLLISSVLMGIVSQDFFGVLERMNVYTVILFFGFLSWIIFHKKQK